MSEPEPEPPKGFSRRAFFKGLGATAVASAAQRVQAVAQDLQAANDEKVLGPGEVPVTLQVDGTPRQLSLEPRVTLLDALRERAGITGPKEVCDRASCGACTVLLDGLPVYSCQMLAIEAQGREITTVAGLAKGGPLTKVQQAFVECDGLQCGYCTPGFVLSVTALLQRNPHPTEHEVRRACAGNLCRCGSYPYVFAAALKAAGASQTT